MNTRALACLITLSIVSPAAAAIQKSGPGQSPSGRILPSASIPTVGSVIPALVPSAPIMVPGAIAAAAPKAEVAGVVARPAGNATAQRVNEMHAAEKKGGEAAAASASVLFDQAKAAAMLPVSSFVLPNGLQVVVQSDHSSPMVAVAITYKVGSQDETKGLSGFAHLFEHLMAQGTKSLKPREISKLIESNGGVRNAYTTRTHTNYHSLVPRGALETVLWAEAERMHTLNVDSRALALEKQVVLEEMRLRYLNAPYRKAQDQGMAETAFAKWENRHTTIGEAADIRDAKLEDVRAFYQAHYAPNNAVIAITGAVTRAEAEELVRLHFASIPTRPIPPAPDLSEPPPAADAKRVVEDPLAKLPKIYVGGRAPARGTKDYWSLMLLGEMLSGEDENPLYQSLVRSAKLALSASANFPWWTNHAMYRGNPELFGYVATLRPGADSAAARAAAESAIKRFADQGPTADELARAKAQVHKGWIKEFDSLLDRAKLLSHYAALIGPVEGLWSDLSQVLALTPQDVAGAAGRWLSSAKSVVEVVPGRPQPAAPVAETEVPPESPRPPGDPRPVVQPTPAPAAPALETFTLSNGLKVVYARDPRLPLLEVRLSMQGGRTAEESGQEGVSHAAAANLFKGAAGKSAAEIAEAFARLGFSISSRASPEALRVDASGLAANAPEFFAELGRTLAGAAFPEPELELWRRKTTEGLKALRNDPDFLASERIKRELFAGHPYGRAYPDEARIAAVSQDRLARFHAKRLRPDGATMVVAGDIEPAALKAALEAGLSGWTGKTARARVGAPRGRGASEIADVIRPGSTQVNLVIAQAVALTPKDDDYLAFQVMNHILGGSATGRLFLNLRVDKGYTYGSYSRLDARDKGLLWTAEAQVRPEIAALALSELRKEIARMRAEDVPLETLESAKRYLSGVFLMRLASLEGFSDYLIQLEKEGLDPKKVLAERLAKIAALTPAQLRAAARKYLDPDKMVTVAVADAPALAALKAP